MSIEHEIKEYFKEEEWNDMSESQKSLFTEFNSTIQIFPVVKEEIIEENPTVTDIPVADYAHFISEIDIKDETLDNSTSNIAKNEEDQVLYCQECKQKYRSFCLNCPMLLHILDNDVKIDICDRTRRTLPKDILTIDQSSRSTNQSPGVFALCTIPENVRFGPCQGLEFIQINSGCAFEIKHGRFVKSKRKDCSNWTLYINCVTKKSDGNLIMFQQKNSLYFRSIRQILKGEELILHYNPDHLVKYIQRDRIFYFPTEDNEIKCVYACTYCCLGFSMETHLRNHKNVCPYVTVADTEPIADIVQCPFCVIYLDEKEYLGFHMTCCCDKHSRKCVLPENPDRIPPPPQSVKNAKRICLDSRKKLPQLSEQKVKSACVDNGKSENKIARKLANIKHIEFVSVDNAAKSKKHMKEAVLRPKRTRMKAIVVKEVRKNARCVPPEKPYLGKNFPYEKFSDENHYENYQTSFITFVGGPREEVKGNIFDTHIKPKRLNNTKGVTACSEKPVSKSKNNIIVIDSSSDDDNSKNETLVKCAACKYEGFTKEGLKEHMKKHRNSFLLQDYKDDFKGFPKAIQNMSIRRSEKFSVFKDFDLNEPVVNTDNEVKKIDVLDGKIGKNSIVNTQGEKELLKDGIHETINPEVHYECAHCQKRYFNKDEFVEHVRPCKSKHRSISKCSTNKQSPNKNIDHRLKYRCKMCSFGTNHLRSFRWHKSRVHKIQEDAIVILKQKRNIEKSNRTRMSSNLNRSNQREAGPFICLTCNEGFLQRRLLEKHVVDHNHELKGKRIISSRKKDSKIKNFICTVSSNEGDVYQCKLCKEVYRQYYTVRVHLRTKHTINDNKPILKCSKCNFQTNYRCNLKRHLYLHEAVKPFECQICQKKFHRKSHFDDHNRSYHISNIDSIFECKECENTYRHKESLKRHLKDVHDYHDDSINVFKCTECSNTYSHKESLRRHFRNTHKKEQEHSVGIFRCQKCSTIYNDKESLMSHRKEAHKPKQQILKCTNCSNTYRHKKSLRRHRQKVHLI